MDIIVKENYAALSKCAAAVIAEAIRKKPDLVLGLYTGSTPLGTYKELIRLHQEESLDFSQVRTFNLDEYVGLGKDLSKPYHQDQSYARFMWEELFKYLNIKPENINIPNGLAKDSEDECRRYEQKIKEVGGIDLQFMGIGSDGHFGFNEPGTSPDLETHVTLLARSTVEDNFRMFFKEAGFKLEDVPTEAITMGIKTVLSARKIYQVANGERKAEIIKNSLTGPITPSLPSSILQKFPDKVTILLDVAAASQLDSVATLSRIAEKA